MKQRILENLNTILGDDYDEALLSILIDKALSNIKKIRNYPNNYTEAMINTDIESYEYQILDIVIKMFNIRGAEGETQRSENSTSHVFASENSFYKDIKPIAKVI